VLTTLIGLGKEFVQDIMRGKTLTADSIPDKSVDSLLGVVGLNRYTVEQGWSKSPFDAAANMILPPTTPYKNLWQDATSMGDGSGLRSVQTIPVIGDLMYYRFGKGATLDEKTAKAKFNDGMKELHREAYIAKVDGDMQKAQQLLTVYNERRVNGPDPSKGKRLSMADLHNPPPGSEEAKIRITASKAKQKQKVGK
jgi:hypothetical protein